MEHDFKCEAETIFDAICRRWAEGVEARDAQVMAMLRALRSSEQMCACTARRWGIDVPIDTGLRLGEKKAERYVRSWVEGSGDEAQKRRINSFVDKALGRNVIDLQEYRVSRSGDSSGE